MVIAVEILKDVNNVINEMYDINNKDNIKNNFIKNSM
jgi:hypothetical protein